MTLHSWARRPLIALLMALGSLAATACAPIEHDNGGHAPTATQRPHSLADDVVTCLAEQGFEASVTPSGGVSAEFPAGTPEAIGDSYFRAEEACWESTGYAASHDLSRYSRNDLERRYAREVASYQCFINLGISAAPPPSLEAYLSAAALGEDVYMSTDSVWDRNPPHEYERAFLECQPPSIYPTATDVPTGR